MSREAVITLVIGVALVGGSYFYFHKEPCEAPITYQIGVVDPQFGISAEEFKSDIARATGIWGEPRGAPLFAYDPEGEVTINLIYDIRQEATDKEKVLSATIDQTSEAANSVRQQFYALKAEYEQASAKYTAQIQAFNQAQAAYNAQVEHWNSAGGAPKAQFDALTREKERLFAWRDTLEGMQQEVDRLAEAVNAYISKYNLLVARINANVNEINNDGLAGTQFEEGLYTVDKDGERITVYQFSDKTDLIRVLAHELGHALALDHNENPDSIMNPVNQSETLMLSSEDSEALKVRCNLE